MDTFQETLFYDSECLMCSRFLRLLNKNSTIPQLKILSTHGDEYKEYCRQHHILEDTVVYVVSDQYFIKSKAIFNLLNKYSTLAPISRIIEFLFPTKMADSMYDVIACLRKKYFMKRKCETGSN